MQPGSLPVPNMEARQASPMDASDQGHFPAHKVALYELLLRQLQDDGFEAEVQALTAQLHLHANNKVEKDALLDIYTKSLKWAFGDEPQPEWQPLHCAPVPPLGPQEKVLDLEGVAIQSGVKSLLAWQSSGIHPCGDFLFVGTTHQALRMYDLQTLSCFTTSHQDQHHAINDLRCTSDGKILANCALSSAQDGSIKLWDAVSNSVVNTFQQASKGILYIAAANSNVRLSDVSLFDSTTGVNTTCFSAYPCQESSSPFNGTLIRIPFRTKESAAKSEISKIVVSDEMVAALSQQFRAEAFQWLLFLQNVQEISMSRLVADESEPVLQTIFSVSLARAGLTKSSRTVRPSIVTCESSGRGTAVSTQLEVLCNDEKQTLRKYHLFTDTQHGFRSRVCLAVPLMQEQDAGGDVWCHDEEGRVFCFLPVPRNVDLGLRLHVHAPLNMAQDRRSVLLDNRIGESEQELVQHNFYLLDDLIPSALMACLQDLAVKRNQMPPAHFFSLFPSLGKGSLAPSERIAKTFYAKLLGGSTACPLPIASPASMRKRSRSEAPPAYWVKVHEAIFVPSGSAALAEQVTQALLDSVVECLLRCGLPLVDAPPSVLDSLMRAGQSKGEGQSDHRKASLSILTPSWLRQRLRSEGGMKSHAINQSPAANIFAQLSPLDVADLLEFAVSDGNMADLSGVPLLMCEDEAVVQPFVAFSQSAQQLQPVFFPQNPLERRLFPNKDGKKLMLASKFETRPVLWSRFKKLAEQAQVAEDKEPKEPRESRAGPAFQCKFVTFPLLVKALQMLLPRTWNNPVPRVSTSDYSEWIEDWLQAMWKWLGDKDVNLFLLVHWPLIPSISDAGIDLVRIPEANKLVLFSGRPAQKAVPLPPPSAYPHPPPPPPPPSSPGTVANNPPKVSASAVSTAGKVQRMDKLLNVQKLLEAHLHCKPIFEPDWLLQHEKQLRTCVHTFSAEGLLKTMHFAAKLISSCQKSPISPSQALHMSLSKALSPHDVGALLSLAATVQKEGCTCEIDSASWKSQCEVLRGLPFLCRFNKPQQHVSLGGTGEIEEFRTLPETCPQVLAALRAAQVDLPTVEVPGEVLETLTSETWAVSSLLRDHLGLPRCQWPDLLLKHIFPWVQKTSSGDLRQSLMRAVIYHWRDMDLTGHSACLEALQQIAFISTVGGGMLSAAEALDPSIEKLPALYGPGEGPFPDLRWQSAECRAVLRFRSHLNYQELNERLGFLHHVEVQRRENSSAAEQENRIPADVLKVSNALLRYVCEVVSPLMGDSFQTASKEEKQDVDSRSLWGMLSLTSGIPGMMERSKTSKASSLSEEELMSIQSKLRRCFWLPPLSAASGWPTEAPWKGSLCGLCSAEEAVTCRDTCDTGMT
eukprot:Skav219587  [mRNA]  locus=scaffold2589:45805:59036:- [translate_table: standard]